MPQKYANWLHNGLNRMLKNVIRAKGEDETECNGKIKKKNVSSLSHFVAYENCYLYLLKVYNHVPVAAAISE
jgi:hypothetical protein